jgi:hypothetical protein
MDNAIRFGFTTGLPLSCAGAAKTPEGSGLGIEVDEEIRHNIFPKTVRGRKMKP